MRCPRCSFPDDKVVDSRSIRDGAGIRRRRECLSCGHRFTTHEEIIQVELKVIKRDMTRQDLDLEKIRRGVEKACWKRNVSQEEIDSLVRKVISDIETTYDREVPASEIGNFIMQHLRELDKVAYVRFASVYRDFQDVDEFINEIRTFVGSGKNRKK
ncbi:MAG: transcriptional repressor NrdR [Lentisphaeria bacterium]|nr:transcriptional repressor NrdR [Lentisphaeria bacterium]